MHPSMSPSRSMTTSTPRQAAHSQSSSAGEMNSWPRSSIWNNSIQVPNLSGLTDFLPEILDRLHEPVIELDLRFPAEQRSGTRDVGTALLRIVGRQRPVDDPAAGAGHADDRLG